MSGHEALLHHLRACADLADKPGDGVAYVGVASLREVIALLADREVRLPTNDELLAIIRDARSFVSDFYPQTADQQRDQEAMLARIDAVLPPPPPAPPIEYCDGQYCCLPKGHEGQCTDIPF